MSKRREKFIAVVMCASVFAGCGSMAEEEDLGFDVEVAEARFLQESMGKKRLYVQARVINESEPGDLRVAVHQLSVVTEGAGVLVPGFHPPETPDEVEKCPTSNNGRAVPEGSTYVCGFVVESESSFEPTELRYSTRADGSEVAVEALFPEEVPES